MFQQFPKLTNPFSDGLTAIFTTVLSTTLLAASVAPEAGSPNTVREQQFRRAWDIPNADMAAGQNEPGVPMRGDMDVRDGFYSTDGGVVYGYPADFSDPQDFSRFTDPAVSILSATPAELMREDIKRLNQAGPVLWQIQLRAGYAYDSVNDTGLGFRDDERSESSFFAGISGLLSYNRTVGQWSVDASYSAGYRYYFDEDFATNGNDWGTLNQTLGLGIEYQGDWLRVLSSTQGSFGQGNDLEAGYNTDRFLISETLTFEAEPGAYNLFGLRLQGDYELYDFDFGGDESDLTNLSAALYWQRDISEKTDFNLEFSVGIDDQDVGLRTDSGFTQYYYEALVGGSYRPTGKLSFRAGIGATWLDYDGERAFRNIPRDNEEVKLAYDFAANYQLTDKTALSLNVSQRETLFVPNISLTALSNPLDSLSLSLSIYQRSSSSSVVGGADLRTIGIVGSVRQSIFDSSSIGLSAGWENAEYLSAATGDNIDGRNIEDDGYGFGELDFVWQINRRFSYDASIGINSSNPRLNSRGDDDLEIYGETSLTFTF
jgi:hypothetical protein